MSDKIDKEDLQQLGLKAIKEYFEVDTEKLSKGTLMHLHQRARLGMQFEREMSIGKRAVEANYIRVFRMMAEDKVELKRLIKKSLPQYR